MKLSIHQPNFLPWLGYFKKIADSDVFIVLDEVQYPRGKTIANRNTIKTSRGPLEIVVPVSKPKGNDGCVTYKQVFFSDDRWRRKILKTIEINYSKSKYYEEYYGYLNTLFGMGDFTEMNVANILETISILGKNNTEIIRMSSISGLSELRNNDLIIELCSRYSCDTYLSGSGGENYNNEELFNESGIGLEYCRYTALEYPQLHGPFAKNLSAIDALFNVGGGAGTLIEDR